jgi:hypothetical protein
MPSDNGRYERSSFRGSKNCIVSAVVHMFETYGDRLGNVKTSNRRVKEDGSRCWGGSIDRISSAQLPSSCLCMIIHFHVKPGSVSTMFGTSPHRNRAPLGRLARQEPQTRISVLRRAPDPFLGRQLPKPEVPTSSALDVQSTYGSRYLIIIWCCAKSKSSLTTPVASCAGNIWRCNRPVP